MSCEQMRRSIVECLADRRAFSSAEVVHLDRCASCAAWAREVQQINELVDAMCTRAALNADIAPAVAQRVARSVPAPRLMTPRFAIGAAVGSLAAVAAALFVTTYSVSVRVVPRTVRMTVVPPEESAAVPPSSEATVHPRSTAGRGGWPHRRSVRTPGAAGPVAERSIAAAVRQRSESQLERQDVPSSDLLLKSPDPTPGTSVVAPEAAPPTVARGAAFDARPERSSVPVVAGDKILVFGAPPAKSYTPRETAGADPTAARPSGGFAALGAARSGPAVGMPAPGEVRIVGGSDVYINPDRGEKADIALCPAADGPVAVRIFSTSGRLLWETQRQVAAGVPLSIEWSGTNAGGQVLASGVYIVVVRGAGIDVRRKICIVR